MNSCIFKADFWYETGIGISNSFSGGKIFTTFKLEGREKPFFWLTQKGYRLLLCKKRRILEVPQKNKWGFWEMSIFWHVDNLCSMYVALLIYAPNLTLQT